MARHGLRDPQSLYSTPYLNLGRDSSGVSGKNLLNSLISYWPMDETSGTRYDSHGSNDLTDNNTVTYATGVQSNAAQFTAANTEYFSHADNSDLSFYNTDYTIAFWFYIDDDTHSNNFLEKGGLATETEFVIEHQSGPANMVHFARDSSGTIIAYANTTGAPVSGYWYFCVCWHDLSEKTLFISLTQSGDNVDGQVESSTYTGTIGNGTTDFTMGVRSYYFYNYADAKMDEVGFWKRVLTRSERIWLYNSGNGRTYSEFG